MLCQFRAFLPPLSPASPGSADDAEGCGVGEVAEEGIEANVLGAAFEEVVGDAALQGVGAAEGAGDVGVVQEQGSGADVEGVAQFEEHAHGRVEEAALDFGDDALVGADPAGQLGLVRSYRLR